MNWGPNHSQMSQFAVHDVPPQIIDPGQIMIFHQPRFPWNKGISLPQLPFGVRSCEVAVIWPPWYTYIYIYMCVLATNVYSCRVLLPKQSVVTKHLSFTPDFWHATKKTWTFTCVQGFYPHKNRRMIDRFVTGIQGKMNHSKVVNPRLEPGGSKNKHLKTWIWCGLSPLPVVVTTRIIPFLVGNPYKPSFPLLLGGGTTQDMMWLKWWDIHNLRPHLQYPFPQQLRSIQITVGLVSPKKWSKRKHMYWNTTKIPIWIQKVLWNHQQNYPLLCLSSLLSKDPSTLRAPQPIPLVVVASVHGSVRGPPARRVVSEGSKTAVTWNLKVGKKQNQIYKAKYVHIYNTINN